MAAVDRLTAAIFGTPQKKQANMHTTTYTQHPEVLEIITGLQGLAAQCPDGLTGSGIRDEAGHEYIDLVMEGGGTLGVALLGYIYVLESANIRFLRLAGTSAGSIVAMLLAGGGPIDASKSAWLIEAVAGKDFGDFIDGDKEVQRFINAVLDPEERSGKKARLSSRVLDDLRDHYGLNPGDHFRDWMAQLLHERGIDTLGQLYALRLGTPAGIHNRHTGQTLPSSRWQRVSVITAELSTGAKVALPDMAQLYWPQPDDVNPADFVRASMSVPVFFYPMVVKDIPTDESAQTRWREQANYHGTIPPEVYFVDGGTMSNFPMSLLYDEQMAQEAPLWGIKMGADRVSYNACDSFGAFAGALLGSLMSFYDNDFLVQHPAYRSQVGVIDTGTHNWLDFHLRDEAKLDLFVRGARAARDFLWQRREQQ